MSPGLAASTKRLRDNGAFYNYLCNYRVDMREMTLF
jgi:hypothetical protein